MREMAFVKKKQSCDGDYTCGTRIRSCITRLKLWPMAGRHPPGVQKFAHELIGVRVFVRYGRDDTTVRAESCQTVC